MRHKIILLLVLLLLASFAVAEEDGEIIFDEDFIIIFDEADFEETIIEDCGILCRFWNSFVGRDNIAGEAYSVNSVSAKKGPLKGKPLMVVNTGKTKYLYEKLGDDHFKYLGRLNKKGGLVKAKGPTEYYNNQGKAVDDKGELDSGKKDSTILTNTAVQKKLNPSATKPKAKGKAAAGKGKAASTNFANYAKVLPPGKPSSIKPDKDGNIIVKYGKTEYKISKPDANGVQTVKRTANGKTEDAGFIYGSHQVKKNSDNTYTFNGETYTGMDAEGKLTGPGGKVTHFPKQSDGTFNAVKKQGDFVTTFFADGRKKIQEGLSDYNTWQFFNSEGKLISEREDEDSVEVTYYDKIGRVNGLCSKGPCDEEKPVVTFRHDIRKCDQPIAKCNCQYDDPACYAKADGTPYGKIGDVPENLRDQIENYQVFTGTAEKGLTTSFIQGGAQGGVSFLPLMIEYGFSSEEYVRKVDQAFAKGWPSVEYFESAICENWYSVLPEDSKESNVAVIKTGAGTVQFIGHIEAEFQEVDTIVCEADNTCPANLDCRPDGFCYDSGASKNAKPASGYLNKISWGVTAPSEEKFVEAEAGKYGSSGDEITFNMHIYLKGGKDFLVFKEVDSTPDINSIKLKTGESSLQKHSPVIVDYSTKVIEKVCIEFGDSKPQTLREGVEAPLVGLGKGYSGDLTESVEKICTSPSKATRGKTLPSVTAGASPKSADVSYCGLNGCLE